MITLKKQAKSELGLTLFFAAFLFLWTTVLILGNHAGEGWLSSDQMEMVYYALQVFMKNVALEMAPKVRCNSVNPGMVETALISGFTEEQKDKEMQNYPLRRFAQPEDIALGIAYLLSDASSFVTGTALKIDGGMTLS